MNAAQQPVGRDAVADMVPLRELVTRIGAGISRAFFPGPGAVPVLRSNNAKNGEVVLDDLKYWHSVDPAGADLEKVKPKPGDVLVNFVNGSRRELGKAAIYRGAPAGCIVSTNFFIVRTNREVLDPEYLNYFLQSNAYARWLSSTCGFSGQGSFNQKQIGALEVPLRPLAEQKHLVRVLDLLGATRQHLKARYEATANLQRGLARQLLTGKKRFSEFRSRPWPSAKLGDHVKPVQRKNIQGCKRVLTASGEHGLVDQREFFNRRVAAADVSGYYLLRRREFAYNRSAMNGYPYGATKRLDAHDEGVLSTLYLCFAISDDELDSDFLRHLFDSGLLNKQLRRIVRVGARAHGLLNVSDSDFFELSIPFPAIDEQRAVAQLLDGLEREIELLSEQRDLYARYKRGLMARLLSGEIEVPA